MKKTHKVIMLPTEKSNKVGDIVLNDAKTLQHNQVRLAILNELTYDSNQPCTNQHLYIISDKQPKDGDWYVHSSYPNELFKLYKDTMHNKAFELEKAKKIVATTDKSLEEEPILGYQRPLPQIPESFIRAYIKAYNEGKPIIEVDLEYDCDHNQIPNKVIDVIKTRPDNTVIIHQSKMYTRDEVIKFIQDFDKYKYGTLHTPATNDKWIQDNL